MNYNIRDVIISDTEELLNIYEYYVLNTAITFEITVPTLDEFKERIINISKEYSYIVIEDDNRILGYAYAHILKDREAYKKSVEVTIYLRHGYTKLGLGKLLYLELEKRLKALGVKNLYACITKPDIPDKYVDNNSEEFHKRMGYTTVGLFHKCGIKYDTWYNVIWMEKIIG